MSWFFFAISLATAAPQDTWVLDESPEVVQKRIDDVIDAAAATFGVFKGVARKKIAPTMVWCRQYEVELGESQVSYRCDTRDPLVTPRAELGSTRRITLPRGPADVTVSWQSPQLTAIFARDDGARRNVFVFDGEVMTLSVEVVSAKLSDPMSFEIRYRRSSQSL